MGKRFRELTQTATDADLVEGNYFGVDTPNVTKKVPANLLAKQSDLYGLLSTIDLNDSSLWTNSQIDSTNGSVSASDSRLSTPDSLALAPNTIFDYAKGANISSLSIYVYAYEDDGTFISGLISVENFPAWIQSHPEAKQFKLSMIPTGSVAVLPSNLDDIVTFNADVYVYNVASREYVDNRCDSLQSDVDELQSTVFSIKSLNDSSLWLTKGVDTNTGTLYDADGRISTILVENLPSDYTFSFSLASGVSIQNKTIYCYHDGTYLGRASNETELSEALALYPTANQFRFGFIGISGTTASAENLSNIATFTADDIKFERYATKEYVDAAIAASGGGGGSTVSSLDLNNTALWDTLTVDGNNGSYYNSGSAGKRLATKEALEIEPTSIFDFTKAAGVSFSGSTVYFYPYTEDGSFLVTGAINFFSVTELATFVANNPTAKKFRLAILSINGTECSAANLANIITFNRTINIVSDAASKAYVDQECAELATRIDAIDRQMITSYNLNSSEMWIDMGVDTNSGVPYVESGRISTNMMDLKDNSTFSFTRASGVTIMTYSVYCYTADGTYLGSKNSATSVESCKETYPTAAKFRLGLIGVSGTTASAANIANIATFTNTLYTDSFATKEYVDEAIANSGASSILTGKKYYACGSSSTKGADGTFESGPYEGQYKSYPLFIAMRNGMDGVNFAVSGSTIAYVSGTSTENNCFTYPSTGALYRIPYDVDYITIKFGVNDSHQSIPIGASSDATNETMWGAWNITLRHLITNCPFAKIGVIVPNGCDTSDYAQVAKDAAKKWGVAFLDENFDYEVPLLPRVNGKPDVSQEVKDLRLQQFCISAQNLHPNDAAQEFESTFVEAFLMRL